MNRQQTKNILDSVQIHGVEMEHFANGGDIEYLEDGNLWQEANQPSFDPNLRYRKKPAPTIRPYNREECEMFMWGNPVVKTKEGGRIIRIHEYDPVRGTFFVDGSWIDSEGLLSRCELRDGSPCGVKEGE